MRLKLFLRAQLYTLLFLLLFFVLTALGAVGLGYLKFRQFSQTSGLSLGKVVEIAKTGWQKSPQQTADRVNFLVLGLDSLKTRGDVPALTDTMMLVSLNLRTAQVNTLSFPRDLWNEAFVTRINALYHYGLERYPQQPEQFPQEVLSEMTGVPIHHVVVLTFDQVSQLIDLLGGIEVEVPVAFVDEEFPRSDVDVTKVHDPKLLYKTVIFVEGKQLMSGEKALEYMRSRKSGDDEGTDVARGTRQQLVLDSLLAKLRQKSTLTNMKLVGQLYAFYQTNFSAVVTPAEGVALVKKLWPVRNGFAITNHSIPIFPDDEQGLIEHPDPRRYRGEWIYIVRDLEKFRNFVQTVLGLKT